MNNQIKILLNIQGIEGGTLRPIGKKRVKWQIQKWELDPQYDRKKKDANDVVAKGSTVIAEFEQIPVSQTIKMTQEAYEYFKSSECPSWFKDKKKWKLMTYKQRIEQHLKRACEDRGGKDFTYSILDD